MTNKQIHILYVIFKACNPAFIAGFYSDYDRADKNKQVMEAHPKIAKAFISSCDLDKDALIENCKL